jgi:hypothetical protein
VYALTPLLVVQGLWGHRGNNVSADGSYHTANLQANGCVLFLSLLSCLSFSQQLTFLSFLIGLEFAVSPVSFPFGIHLVSPVFQLCPTAFATEFRDQTLDPVIPVVECVSVCGVMSQITKLTSGQALWVQKPFQSVTVQLERILKPLKQPL